MSERDGESLPAVGSAAARELFVSYYRARYGPHPAERNPGEFRLWAKAIDGVEPRNFERVVELMAAGRDVRDKGRTKPRLDDLRAAIGRMRARAASWAPEATADCAFCGGRGEIAVPARQRKDGGYVFETAEGDRTPLNMTAFPCKCSAGDPFRARVPAAAVDGAFEVARQALRACGLDRDDGRAMSLSEFLAQHRGDKVLGPARLYADTVRESYRVVYGPGAAPPADDGVRPSRTLAYLRAREAKKVPAAREAARGVAPGPVTAADVALAMRAPPPVPEDEYEREERLAIEDVELNRAGGDV